MAEGNRHVDACIVCAKPDEADVVVKEFSSRRHVFHHQDFTENDNNFKEEFFVFALWETFYESVEALQTDFDRWLISYNTERPHQGYRNLGNRPIDTVNADLQSVKKEA